VSSVWLTSLMRLTEDRISTHIDPQKTELGERHAVPRHKHFGRAPAAARKRRQSTPYTYITRQVDIPIDAASSLVHTFKMPPRVSLRLRFPVSAKRFYSAAADSNAQLITVTHLPAPNSGHIRILELNRPKARNAISKALLSQLRAQIEDVHSQYDEAGNELPPKKVFGGAAGVDAKGPTRAIIIASAVNSSFCAGADLKERKTFTKDE
jgi:hypothetical protein